MYEKAPLNLVTIVNETVSGEGVYVDTSAKGRLPGESRARLFLNVTALVAGTAPTMDVTIVALIAGVDQVVAAFAQSTEGPSQQSIVIEACPSSVKVVYAAGGTVVDFDATVDIIRF